MKRLTSSLVTIAVLGLCAVSAVIGCSADGGGSGAIDETAATEPEQPAAQLPPSSSSGSGGPEVDAGKPKPKDAGAKEASAVDAGPPPPVSGTACPTIDEIRKKPCGACGTQSTICLATTGGTPKWSDYSPCGGELAGGCIPGSVVNEACGNCGTQTKTCTQYCAFTTASCTGQPAASCVPGGIDLSNAGCSADTFRRRSCKGTCTYDNFGVTCDAPPNVVEVGPTPGSVNSTVAILSETQTLSRMSGICPTATLSTTITSPYIYLQVHNPLATAATVAIYNSLATGGVAFKTAMAAYDGAVAPTDDATRKACLKGVSTYGTTALTGDSKFASLDGTKAVTIAAGATVTVYVGAYNAFDPTKPADSTGKVKLNVQTISVP